VKFYLDTADIAEIEEAHSWGVLSGVTTNPTLYSRVGGKLADFHDHIKRICDIVQGPVSAETVSLKRDEIVAEGTGFMRGTALHVVDALALVHALILRIQALVLPFKVLVFGGH